ncbi:MAG: hypothetical protein U1E60_31515 [Reyranellaceae bacterium]
MSPVDVEAFEAAETARRAAAAVDGRHYAEFVDEVKQLRRDGDLDAAAGLLLRLVEAVEREAAIPLAGRVAVPPWYHRQLASVYRKLGSTKQAELVLLRLQVLEAKVRASGMKALEEMRAAAAQPMSSRRGAAYLLGRSIGRLFQRWRCQRGMSGRELFGDVSDMRRMRRKPLDRGGATLRPTPHQPAGAGLLRSESAGAPAIYGERSVVELDRDQLLQFLAFCAGALGRRWGTLLGTPAPLTLLPLGGLVRLHLDQPDAIAVALDAVVLRARWRLLPQLAAELLEDG